MIPNRHEPPTRPANRISRRSRFNTALLLQITLTAVVILFAIGLAAYIASEPESYNSGNTHSCPR